MLNIGLSLFLVLLLYSCASQNSVRVRTSTQPAQTPTKTISPLVEEKVFLEEFKKETENLVGAPASKADLKVNSLSDSGRGRPLKREGEVRGNFFKTSHIHNFIMGIILLLMMSILWRAVSLIRIFFLLMKKRDEDELFSKKKVAESALAPPVSLYLNSLDLKTIDLVSRVKEMDRIDYHEWELIVFRDLDQKDLDAIALDEYKLRYRSPLYFSDLQTEEPCEILEVEGKKRILIVYSQKENSEHFLKLFLKLARYPLVLFMHETSILYDYALSHLAYLWLKEKDKNGCVYGLVKTDKSNPLWTFFQSNRLQQTLFRGDSVYRLDEWMQNQHVISLIPKTIAIQSVKKEDSKINLFELGNKELLYEYVAEKKNLEPSLLLRGILGVKAILFSWISRIKLAFRNMTANVGIKQRLDQAAYFLMFILWPSIIFLLVWEGVKADTLSTFWFLLASEVIVLFLVVLIRFFGMSSKTEKIRFFNIPLKYQHFKQQS